MTYSLARWETDQRTYHILVEIGACGRIEHALSEAVASILVYARVRFSTREFYHSFKPLHRMSLTAMQQFKLMLNSKPRALRRSIFAIQFLFSFSSCRHLPQDDFSSFFFIHIHGMLHVLLWPHYSWVINDWKFKIIFHCSSTKQSRSKFHLSLNSIIPITDRMKMEILMVDQFTRASTINHQNCIVNFVWNWPCLVQTNTKTFRKHWRLQWKLIAVSSITENYFSQQRGFCTWHETILFSRCTWDAKLDIQWQNQ